MIVDHLDNWKLYFKDSIWETIFAQVQDLNENSEAGEKKIKGDDIILKVFSHVTIEPANSEAELESHKKYIDIHTTITKSERIDCYPASGLKIIKPYNAAEDEVYYKRPRSVCASLNMYPGIFAMFWPDDAHMPRLQVAGKPELIKKAVMKIRIDLVQAR